MSFTADIDNEILSDIFSGTGQTSPFAMRLVKFDNGINDCLCSQHCHKNALSVFICDFRLLLRADFRTGKALKLKQYTSSIWN